MRTSRRGSKRERHTLAPPDYAGILSGIMAGSRHKLCPDCEWHNAFQFVVEFPNVAVAHPSTHHRTSLHPCTGTVTGIPFASLTRVPHGISAFEHHTSTERTPTLSKNDKKPWRVGCVHAPTTDTGHKAWCIFVWDGWSGHIRPKHPTAADRAPCLRPADPR